MLLSATTEGTADYCNREHPYGVTVGLERLQPSGEEVLKSQRQDLRLELQEAFH